MNLKLKKIKLYNLSLPHIMRGEMPRELLTRIREWMDRGMTGFLVRNLETFAVLRKAGLAEKCVLDHSMYTWNDEAADFWKDQKVLRNTVPLELNEGEIRHRDNRDSEMLIYGYLPLMISAQCVHKNLYGCNHKEEGVTLKDRYDKEFTAKCICNPWKTENTDFCIPCYNIIYNSIPYGLLKEKSQIDRLGVSSLRLAFTIENHIYRLSFGGCKTIPTPTSKAKQDSPLAKPQKATRKSVNQPSILQT